MVRDGKLRNMKFYDLREHFKEHAADFGFDSLQKYLEHALSNVAKGHRVKFTVQGGLFGSVPRYNFISKIGPGKWAVTSTNLSKNKIFTHHVWGPSDIINKGIKLPKGLR